MTSAATALYKALHKKRAYTKLYWDVANAIGINQALLIEIVERWCELNQEKGKSSYYQQGEWWTSATYQEWAEKYPALGGWKSIQRVFLGLEKNSYILSGRFTKGSQAKYYRVNPEAIGELLLTGTLKDEIGIVSKSDGIVSDSDNTISKMDGIVSKSDGTVPDLDVPLYIDQIIQKDHSNIPLTPQGEEEEVGEPEKSASLEESGIPTQSPLPEQPCQQSNSNNDTPYPEDKSSASGCDNSAFVGHGNVAPDGKTRPFNQLTGKWSSIPSDPWMEGINPAKEFKQWVCKQAIAEGKNYSLSNAAGEIRNNFQRAGDLWDEYLDAQEKARQTEIIKEQVQQETKPRAVEVTASQSQPTPFAFYRNAIKNRLPMLQQFRQRGIEWAEQQPDVVIIRDENGEIIDIEEF